MEQMFSKGNGIETTEGQAQCDRKMTILSKKGLTTELRCVSNHEKISSYIRLILLFLIYSY